MIAHICVLTEVSVGLGAPSGERIEGDVVRAARGIEGQDRCRGVPAKLRNVTGVRLSVQR